MNKTVEFYEKMKQLQEIQHSNEDQRIDLERQLNVYVRSDKRLAKLKAVRLQSYWKKICEDEKKSRWRNEQLLKDFERVEAHMEELNNRSDKLQNMKKRFEEHVENMYPDWKEKVLFYQKFKEHQEAQDRNRELEKSKNALRAKAAQEIYDQQRQAQEASHILHKEYEDSQSHVRRRDIFDIQAGDTVSRNDNYTFNKMKLDSNLENYKMTDPANNLNSLSSIPSGTGLSTGFSGRSMQATSTPHPGNQHTVEQQNKIEEESLHSKTSSKQTVRERTVSPMTHDDSLLISPRPAAKQQYNTAPSAPITQQQVESFMTTAEEGDNKYSYKSNPKTPSPRTPRGNKQEEKTDEGNESDEFGSVEDLPTSVATDIQSSPKPSTYATPVVLPDTGAESDRSIYARTELTLVGMYNILSALLEHIESPSAHTWYRGDSRPAQTVQTEIIDNANRNTQLNYFDSTSLSMVILDQLPLLIADTATHCVLPDPVLFKPPPLITLSSVRAKIPHTVQGIWDKLFEHFVQLCKHKVMMKKEIATVFAQYLISSDSPYEEKAIDLLHELLEESVPDNTMQSPNSTSTFSATPRRVPQVLQSKTTISDDDDDDFFEKEPPKDDPLPSSAAYRQMIGSTQSTHKSVSYIESEDDEDEIEKQIASPKPKALSSSLNKESVVDNKLKAGTASPKPMLSPNREGAMSPMSGRGSPMTFSAGEFPAYVPSGLLDTGRSTIGQSTLSSLGSTGKKPGFIPDSDTDEDVDLNQGAASKQDDFDFYD